MAKLPTPKFNLRKRNAKTETLISLFFRYRGNRLVHSTGYSILPSEWNFDSQRPIEKERRNDLFKIHNKLDELASTCKRIYIENDYGNISVDDFKAELDREANEKPANSLSKLLAKSEFKREEYFEFIAKEIKEFEVTDMKKSSLKTFKSHAKILREFGEFYNKRELFTYEDVDWNFRLKMIDWLAERNVQLAYGNKTLKILRQFLEAARRQKLHTNTEYQGKGWTIARKKAKGQNVVFTSSELSILAKMKFSGHLDKIRDICLIGAGTGQRYSDFSKYKPEQFSNSFNGIPLISVISDKTDTPAKIPLNIFPWLIPVLEKHEFSTPKMSMQKFNNGVKELADKAGFDDKTLVVNQYMGRKAKVEKLYIAKYKLVSSHLCRKSFATNLYRMGFRLSQIMPMTGHATESQLREYIGIDNEQNAEEIGLMFVNRNELLPRTG